MTVGLRRLGLGLLGAILFVAVWIGVVGFAHAGRLRPGIADIAVTAAGLLTYAGWVRAAERRSVTELSPRTLPALLGGGFAGGIVLFGIVIAALAASGYYRVRGIGEPLALFRALVPWFSGAIMEELLFRGFVFRVVREVAGTGIAIALSALLFGFIHAANPGATVFSSVSIALEAGVLLAVAYAATESLWLPIGIHAGWNYAEGTIFGTAVSGGATTTPVFLHGSLTGNPLVTGGAFGPEASIIAIPVCLAAAALLARRVKRRRLVETRA